jgi:hypothetical protein
MLASRGSAATASTASSVLSIRKNGIQIGTASWSAGGTSATLAMGSATSFAIGDILTVGAPASPDSTLANISLSMLGSLI